MGKGFRKKAISKFSKQASAIFPEFKDCQFSNIPAVQNSAIFCALHRLRNVAGFVAHSLLTLIL
jgi:hypothetical protein